MAAIVHTVDIGAPPAEVFAYVTDPSHFTEWQDAVVSAVLEDDVLSRGSRILLTRKTGPQTQTVTSEITEYNPPHGYAFRVLDGPVRAIGRGTLAPLDEGARTRYQFELDFEGHGIGKILVPLVVRRQGAKELQLSHEMPWAGRGRALRLRRRSALARGARRES